MSEQQLPERPDLDQLRRLAKELRDAARAGDPGAVERVKRHLRPSADPLALAAAQLAVAREHGFTSWPRLKAAVERPPMSLHDAVDANDVDAVRLLLERGADPNDGHAIAHAVWHRDRRCLQLLLDHGARVRGTGALAGLIGRGDVEGVRLLLDHGADPGRPHPGVPAPRGLLPDLTELPLPLAARRDSAAVAEVLLQAGADPDAPGRDGRSPLRAAVRRGASDVAAVILGHGARDDATDVDRFLGACALGERAEAERLLAPGLDLTGEDHAVLVDAAESADPAVVRLMLELGFPAGARRGADGGSALHAAAYWGREDVVRLLIDAGADVEARDGQWDSTALCWAAVGSGEQPRAAWPADWPGTVRALLAAGASTRGAWVDDKPPSAEVAELIRPSGTAERLAEDAPPAVDPAVLARIEGRLRDAFETGDADLLASLLHPDVRWGSGGGRACWNRDQVMDWYRVLRERFGPVRVGRTEVHEDGVQLFVPVPGRPDWSQTFRVAGESIVEISG
jgi:ankyrin repeat protein